MGAMDSPDAPAVTDRPAFLRGLALCAGWFWALPGPHARTPRAAPRPAATGLDPGDRAIVRAAQLAEALAVTTYDHLITTAPLFAHLFPQDQAYLRAARQQEMAHYLLFQRLVAAPTPPTVFYYPRGMFATARTTLNTLVTLEESFIAAYLVAVRAFSTPDLRVAAARILGVESDHRTMARVLAPGVDPADGGPLRTVTGATGVAEGVDPASNNGYERTLGWTRLDQVATALAPFVDRVAARRAGFDASRGYAFRPFTPTLPTPLGSF